MSWVELYHWSSRDYFHRNIVGNSTRLFTMMAHLEIEGTSLHLLLACIATGSSIGSKICRGHFISRLGSS